MWRGEMAKERGRWQKGCGVEALFGSSKAKKYSLTLYLQDRSAGEGIYIYICEMDVITLCRRTKPTPGEAGTWILLHVLFLTPLQQLLSTTSPLWLLLLLRLVVLTWLPTATSSLDLVDTIVNHYPHLGDSPLDGDYGRGPAPDHKPHLSRHLA